MKKKKKKILKPIDIDAHFKYRCPKCSLEHWISLNEARTKNFKIVCDCKKVFSPKRIIKLKVVYDTVIKKVSNESAVTSTVQETQSAPKNTTPNSFALKPSHKAIDPDVLNKCLLTLVKYGFTKKESEELINKVYENDPSDDCGYLIKLALKSLGDQ